MTSGTQNIIQGNWTSRGTQNINQGNWVSQVCNPYYFKILNLVEIE